AVPHVTDGARDYRVYACTHPPARLLGTEKTGVSAEAAALADEHLVIPMHGMVQSFNVSVAAALLLSEAQRQRQQAGMFNQRRIADDDYQRLKFEWCQPQVARICQRLQLPYPPLRDDGELADPQGFSALVNQRDAETV